MFSDYMGMTVVAGVLIGGAVFLLFQAKNFRTRQRQKSASATRTGAAKERLEMPDEPGYPRNAEWEAMPDVGLEVWPTYEAGTDFPMWANAQAVALRRRDAQSLDWDRLAELISELAQVEQQKLEQRI